jgi:integrase
MLDSNSTTSPATDKPAQPQDDQGPAGTGAATLASPAAAKPTGKAAKPYPDYPLFLHATGQWAKRIKGKVYYFGKDADLALAKYLKEKDALYAGKKPRDQAEGLTVKWLCNKFLTFKESLVESGELTQRSWDDYKAACDLVVEHFGKGRLVDDLESDDFAGLRKKMAKKWGPVTLTNVIQRIRVIFNYAHDERLVEREVIYGQNFKRPSRKTIRLDKARKGLKLFTAEEVRRLLDAAPVHLKAMLLLGINAGLGNADVGGLRLSHLDLEQGWLDFPRVKTGIPRRAKLWPETVLALREALARRAEPKDAKDADMIFITKYGLPWARNTSDQVVAKEFGKLLRRLGMNGRSGRGFYTLRHTYRTTADATLDQPAVDWSMGHEAKHMASVYRQAIGDARLEAVAVYVQRWLFGEVAQPDAALAQPRERGREEEE